MTVRGGTDTRERCFETMERATEEPSERSLDMLYYALMFLIVGLVAGVLGLSGVAAVAGQISWILFVIGLVLLVVHLVRGRAPRTL